MSTKYKYHKPEGTDFISNVVVYWIDNDDLPGCRRATSEKHLRHGGPAVVVATPGTGIPKAYLQYLLFDNNFNYLTSIPVGNTYDMVSVNARVMHDAMGQVINVPHEHLVLEL